MKTAFLFPGQGSQIIGMGRDFYDNFSIARDTFAEVDDALGQNLSAIIFNGPSDALTLTVNAQPAIMVTSIAILRSLLQTRGKKIEDLCQYVAGHSLGEYTALCAAEAISLSDTAKLLRLRGESMQAAVAPGVGAMAAILGMDLGQLNEILALMSAKENFVCQIANDNCPGQIVISGDTEAVDLICTQVIEKGGKAIKLPVSAPFHCTLMDPVKSIMKAALENTKVNAPKVPLINNILATQTSDPSEIIAGLVTQVSGMVRWRESMLYLKQLNCLNLVEISAGKILSNINKRIDLEFNLTNIQLDQLV